MADVSSNQADWMVWRMRFRTVAARELPKRWGGYDVAAVDELRAEILSFIDEWDGQLGDGLERGQAQIAHLTEQLTQAEAARNKSKRTFAAVETERDQLAHRCQQMEAEVAELRARPDAYDLAGGRIAAVLRAADAEAARVREDAAAEMSELVIRASAEAEAFRQGAADDADRVRAVASADAQRLLDDARIEADQIKAEQIKSEPPPVVNVTLDEAAETAKTKRRRRGRSPVPSRPADVDLVGPSPNPPAGLGSPSTATATFLHALSDCLAPPEQLAIGDRLDVVG
jgi:cell division septum initiation protein DivIVA